MAERIARWEEDKADGAGDGSSTPSTSKLKPPLILLQEVSSQVRYLVKEGKIAVHSVMAIWVGSPYGAAEAFKISQNSAGWTAEEEMETKFSAAILDMIDILLNLQHEDPGAFWHGGLKDAALEALVPLAAQVAQLRRKLSRMTATLERQALELGRVLGDLERTTQETSPKSTSSSLVHKKTGHCNKIRQVMRLAWFSLSSASQSSKKSPHSNSKNEKFDIEKQSTSKSHIVHQTDGCKNNSKLTENSIQDRQTNSPALSRNKSDSLGGRGHFCIQQLHIGHINAGGASQDFHPRPRLVPSILFVRHEPEISIGNGIQDENKNPQNGNQVEAEVKIHVNQEVKCTSYLRDYENCRCKINMDEIDLERSTCQVNNNSNQTDAKSKISDAAPKNSDATNKNLDVTSENFDATPKNFDATPKNFDATPKNFDATPKNFDATSKNSDTPPENSDAPPKESDAPPKKSDVTLEKSREVVIVRSAVSNFAESEFGQIDIEDLEWLRGIEASSGQPNHICIADEIEQSERLKRQSIFMHCFRYRAEEMLKDVHNVSQTLRNVEKRWVDAGARSDTNNNFELDQLMKLMGEMGAGLTRQFSTQSQRLEVIELTKSAHRDLVGCFGSFTRFLTMITADTNFLRDLSLGFRDQNNNNHLRSREIDVKRSKVNLVPKTCPIKDLEEIFTASVV